MRDRRARGAIAVVATAVACCLMPAQSSAAEDVVVPPAAPAVEPRLDLQLLAAGGARLGCRRVAMACTVEERGGMRLVVATTPSDAFVGARVRLERRWRAPATRRLVALAPHRATLLDRSEAASVPLARVVDRPGTWCVRATLDAADGRRFESQQRCVRYRPPITVGWAGDIVVGSSYGLPPNGGRDQFAAVDHLLRRPDLMVGNYEGTLSRGGTPRCSGGLLCYIFQAPPDRARNLARAGFDVMSLANNHALDMGVSGRTQTVAALRGVGVRAAGLPGQVHVEQVADTRVAIVGISPYPGTTNMRDEGEVRRLVRAAASRADVVVVAMHVGLEGAAGAHVPSGADYGTPTRRIAHAAIDAGAHAVVGSGPHVVRGVERRRGRFIAYSTGNFAGWHNFAGGGVSAQSGVLELRFDHRGATAGGRWHPVLLRGPGIPHPDTSGRVLRRVAALSRADFGARGARVSPAGFLR